MAVQIIKGILTYCKNSIFREDSNLNLKRNSTILYENIRTFYTVVLIRGNTNTTISRLLQIIENRKFFNAKFAVRNE